MNVYLSRLLRWGAAGCALLLVGLVPGVGPAGAAPLPGAGTAGPPTANGTGQTADQMATLWDQFRTTQLKATQLNGQITQLNAKIAHLKAQIAAETARQAKLQAQIAAYGTQITQAEAQQVADAAQLSATDQQLVGLQSSIGDTASRAAGLRAQVQARAVSMYEQGPSSYIGMLLSAHSFRDFVSRLHFVGGVLGGDRNELTSLEQLTTQLGQQKDQATQHRADIAAAQAAVAADAARIAGLKANLTQASQTLAASVVSDQAAVSDNQTTDVQVRALLAEVEAEKATYVQAMATLAGESSSITTMLRSRQINESYAWAGKKLLWPVTGPISSPFGPRISPIFGTPEFHTGVDIAVDYGVPIKAAEAGLVIFASVMEGYGNVVIIDHGGALATLYAHMSALGVHQGQAVTRGEQIGNVGCTGLCTGPHVHFETRIGGTPVQPLNLLP